MWKSGKYSPAIKEKKEMPGTYLLDTAPLVYLMGQEDYVPVAVRRELADPKSEVFYSQISLWEIQIKYQLGKLPMTDEPAIALPRELARYGFTQLDLTDAAIYGLSRLPPAHRDPFDRILIVQAKLTGSTLVSPDKNFSKYPVAVFW
jgi:PIN domain nuclease of toxin-antitoxin system